MAYLSVRAGSFLCRAGMTSNSDRKVVLTFTSGTVVLVAKPCPRINRLKPGPAEGLRTTRLRASKNANAEFAETAPFMPELDRALSGAWRCIRASQTSPLSSGLRQYLGEAK